MHRRKHDANPTVRVNLKVADPVQAEGVLPPEMREDGSAVTGNANLPAMGVPGYLKIDRMVGGPVREIGFMHSNNRGLGWRNSLQRFIQVVRVFKDIVYAHDPDALPISFQRHGFIAQNVKAMAIERIGDDIGTVPMIVVTKNRDHPSCWQSSWQSSCHWLKDFGARLGVVGALRSIGQSKGVRNEIASKNGEIGF